MCTKLKKWLLKKLNAVPKEEVEKNYVLKAKAIDFVGLQPIEYKIIEYESKSIFGKVRVPEYMLYTIEKLNGKDFEINDFPQIKGALLNEIAHQLEDYMDIVTFYEPKTMTYMVSGRVVVGIRK